jgi:hypothetical protein
MKSIARLLGLAFLVATLSACTLEMPSSIGATTEQHTNGAPVKSWTLTETQARTLADWFSQHQSGWSPSYVTYVPRVLIRLKHANGKESSVNVLPPGLVVVNSMDGYQFSQSFEAKTVEQLVAIVGANGG